MEEELIPARLKRKASNEFSESDWETFRRWQFNTEHTNLNPGTLGTLSKSVKESLAHFYSETSSAYPLDEYQKGRLYLEKCLEYSSLLFKTGMHCSITQGTTETLNLLFLSFIASNRKSTLSVLTFEEEHIGGTGFFDTHRSITVDKAAGINSFYEMLSRNNYDIVFFSHITYIYGTEYPVHDLVSAIRNTQGKAIIVIDCAQSLALAGLPQVDADFMVASAHKWLFGPRGLGFLWVSSKQLKVFDGLFLNGDWLHGDVERQRFMRAGGHDFSAYAALVSSLQLYQAIGSRVIQQRSTQLAEYLSNRVKNILDNKHVKYQGLPGNPLRHGFFSIDFEEVDPYPIYQALNKEKVHIKCIKKPGINVLRWGVPYFESKRRLDLVATIFEKTL